MKTHISFIIILLLSIPQFYCKEEKKEVSKLIIQYSIGNVTIKSANGERDPVIGESIDQGDTIITSKKSIIDIQYGTNGVLRINENSRIEIALLLSRDGAEHSKLNMSEGKLFVAISKLTKNSKFEVTTNTTVAAVRGTSFRITADKKASKIDVLSGKIKVNPVKDGKVVKEIEKIVETNSTLVMDIKSVDEIVKGKKEIEVATLKPEEIEEIREEVKDIKVNELLKEEVKNEIKEVILEEKTDEAEEERLEKKKSEREALEKRKRIERERLRSERIKKARLERERRERERKEREMIEKAKKERETKEQRVRNIPNL